MNLSTAALVCLMVGEVLTRLAVAPASTKAVVRASSLLAAGPFSSRPQMMEGEVLTRSAVALVLMKAVVRASTLLAAGPFSSRLPMVVGEVLTRLAVAPASTKAEAVRVSTPLAAPLFYLPILRVVGRALMVAAQQIFLPRRTAASIPRAVQA